MHAGMSNVFSLQESLTPLPSPLTSESLIHFAKESELNQNYELAARYYQEVCFKQVEQFVCTFKMLKNLCILRYTF